MSTKEREPLFSDAVIHNMLLSRSTVSDTPSYAWTDGAHDVRDLYEAARAKDAELIQRFVDHNDKWLGKGCIEADIEWDNIVLDCIKAGYKPSEP